MAFVGRLFHGLQGLFAGRSRALAGARSAEFHGEFERAVALFEQGGRPDEAARVRRARALSALAQSAAPVTSSARQDLVTLAVELESLGEFERAAEAYARASDPDGQARALGDAGEVDRLDDLLVSRQARSRDELALRGAHELFAMLVASGQRREAVRLSRGSADDGLRSLGRAVEARRVAGPVVQARVRGHAKTLVLGERVAIGRARAEPAGEGRADEDAGLGMILVPSAAVSRRHLSIARRGGEVWIRDLGSHNGTTLRGAPMTGEVAVGDGIELRLGNEVPLVVRLVGEGPDEGPRAIAIEVAGVRYVAPLGPARLGLGAWRLEWSRGTASVEGRDEARDEAWVELATDDRSPAYAGGLRLAERVTLLVGDAITNERPGEPVLAILGAEG